MLFAVCRGKVGASVQHWLHSMHRKISCWACMLPQIEHGGCCAGGALPKEQPVLESLLTHSQWLSFLF